MRFSYGSFALFLSGLLLLELGCSSASKRHHSAARAAVPDGTETFRLAYERAPWRVASFEELDRTVLWISHILIRHDQVQADESPLRPFGWAPDAPSKRSKADARKLAERLAEKARKNPESFEQLARQYSEDEVTRDSGGSLGARRASSLPANFLDAAAALESGQTSQVVPTALGFHVLLLRNPPPDLQIAGRRVTIRYASTVGRDNITRSRDDARAFAREVLAKAQTGVPFDQLVAEYSESDDRALGGAIGTWSTREPSADPMAVEALARVGVREIVAKPLESRFGFEILQRTEPSAPVELSAEVAFFAADASAAEDVTRARRDAEKLIAAAEHDPTAVGEHSKLPPARWILGRGDPLLTAAVRDLRPGEISHAPVAIDGGFLVVRRVPIEGACAPPPMRYELPRPRVASLTLLDTLVRNSDPRQLAYSLGQVTDRVAGILSADEKAPITRVFAELGDAFASADTPEKRVAAYRNALTALHRSLSEARYAQITGLLQRWVSNEMTGIYRP